ncbi:DUF6705 family protein [Chryseobacterium echinoideorum]|uniref:DUF6705 family protein n=1 Tax=Chryseobacterium echinoideorum TaxID=1549648 RepID=UPI001184F99A|nr:DUF6705 family protein [Chryseobacterium echinoideorum]
MNKLILIVITIFSISCKSQTNIVDIVNICNSHPFNSSNGSLYKKDISNLYVPFLGTWKWTSGNREMTLVLQKQTKHHYTSGNDNYFEDRMVGYYIYKENGNIIIDTSNDNLNKDYGLTVEFTILCNGSISTAFFKDPPKKKYYKVLLEKLSPSQMRFTASMDENGIIPPNPGEVVIIPGGTSFPPNMIFTKQ